MVSEKYGVSAKSERVSKSRRSRKDQERVSDSGFCENQYAARNLDFSNLKQNSEVSGSDF